MLAAPARASASFDARADRLFDLCAAYVMDGGLTQEEFWESSPWWLRKYGEALNRRNAKIEREQARRMKKR